MEAGAGGAGESVRIVSQAEFQKILGEATLGSEPVETPASYLGVWYKRHDGAVVGVRFGSYCGVLVEVIESSDASIFRSMKICVL